MQLENSTDVCNYSLSYNNLFSVDQIGISPGPHPYSGLIKHQWWIVCVQIMIIILFFFYDRTEPPIVWLHKDTEQYREHTERLVVSTAAVRAGAN